ICGFRSAKSHFESYFSCRADRWVSGSAVIGEGAVKRLNSKKTSPKGRFTMLKLNSSRPGARLVVLALITLSTFLASSIVLAQTSVSTGSVSGNVTDATGAVLGNATVVLI